MYEFIKHRLKNMGKTQKELADFLDMPPPHLSAIFKGIRLIRATEIVPIAKFLKIDIEDFAKYIAGEITEDKIRNEKTSEDFLNEEEREFIRILRATKLSKSTNNMANTKAG